VRVRARTGVRDSYAATRRLRTLISKRFCLFFYVVTNQYDTDNFFLFCISVVRDNILDQIV
jgi:hypothetical protein